MDTVLVQTMQFKNLLNPTPIGSSLEIVDYLEIEAPDGSRRKCRVIHDEYGAKDTMADLSLSSYSHGSQDVHVTMGSATGDEHMVTDLIHLKVILPDNSYKIVKAISANMRSKKAFTIAQKMIDVPRLWNEKYFSNRGLVGTNNEQVVGPQENVHVGGSFHLIIKPQFVICSNQAPIRKVFRIP